MAASLGVSSDTDTDSKIAQQFMQNISNKINPVVFLKATKLAGTKGMID